MFDAGSTGIGGPSRVSPIKTENGGEEFLRFPRGCGERKDRDRWAGVRGQESGFRPLIPDPRICVVSDGGIPYKIVAPTTQEAGYET